MSDIDAIDAHIQHELARRGKAAVVPRDAELWLASAGLLGNSECRPGLRLRKLLRQGLIRSARQEPNHRWYIDRA